MATIQEIIARVDERKPNAFSTERKVEWIAELDGRIALDVMLMDIAEAQQFRYLAPAALNYTPLAHFPHDSLYDAWLEAMIDYSNGEYNKYQNSMELYNARYSDFVRWFVRTYEPSQGYRGDFNGKR